MNTLVTVTCLLAALVSIGKVFPNFAPFVRKFLRYKDLFILTIDRKREEMNRESIFADRCTWHRSRHRSRKVHGVFDARYNAMRRRTSHFGR